MDVWFRRLPRSGLWMYSCRSLALLCRVKIGSWKECNWVNSVSMSKVEWTASLALACASLKFRDSFSGMAVPTLPRAIRASVRVRRDDQGSRLGSLCGFGFI